MMRRFWAVLVARNKEFLRDRASLAWNLLFPLGVVFFFAFIFTDRGQTVFKVAVLGTGEAPVQVPGPFFATRHVQFVPVRDLSKALSKVANYQIDMLIDPAPPGRYWVNPGSPKGYLLERILWGSEGRESFAKQTVEGRQVRYVDWLLPGLLAMNMMFSCLFGVGYVLVRYRHNGVLRRLKATPLSAFEFLCAQIGSRFVLVMGVTVLIFIASDLFLDFRMVGSYLELLAVFSLGAVCLIALGLLLAARTASEELAGGLLNLVSWPMMLLSGVWFSLEGTPHWVRGVSQAFPLTHVIDAARAIMLDGAGLAEVAGDLLALASMALALLVAGSLLFRWE